MKIGGGHYNPAVSQQDARVESRRTSASARLELDPTSSIVDVNVNGLGTPRQVTASLERLDREMGRSLQELSNSLGEKDHVTKDKIVRYVETGAIPSGPGQPEIFDHVDQGVESVEGRLKAVLEAGMELLDPAKGPGLNALNVAAHTGLVIALATVLRQYVGFLVEHALHEGDAPEASRAWAAVSLAMVGPALTLMGALRREFAGEASWKSRVGCLCMASAVMGSMIGAVVTGAASKLFPSMVGGVVYIGARAVAQSFFPLKDNAGPANAAATGVTAAAYGAVQFALAELGKILPLSGAARAAGELGHEFGADALHAGLNALGMVVDVAILVLCKSWHVLSPQQGLDSVFSDPETLQQMALEVRVGAQRPTMTQLADAFVNVAGLRLSFGHAVSLTVGVAASLLSESEIGDDTQGHLLNGCFAVMMMLLYFPLIFANLKRTDNTYALPQETTTP